MTLVSSTGTRGGGASLSGQARHPSLVHWDSLCWLACSRCSVHVNDWMNVGASLEFLPAPDRSRGTELPFCSQALRHGDAADGSSLDA